MNSIPQTSFQIVEVQSANNLRALENIAKVTWHKKADALDAWACKNCIDEVAKQKILSSYTTTRELGRLLRDLTERPETLPNTRVFCSLDPVSRAVEGILVTRAKESTCEIMFALSNPDNLAVPGKQENTKRGAIAVLMQHVVQNGKKFKDYMVEAKEPANQLCKRAGFVETSEDFYLKEMRLTQAKAQELLSKMSFNGEVVPEPESL